MKGLDKRTEVRWAELRVHQPGQNAGLADPLVADDDQLEQEVAGLSLSHLSAKQVVTPTVNSTRTIIDSSSNKGGIIVGRLSLSKSGLNFDGFETKESREPPKPKPTPKRSISIEIFRPSLKVAHNPLSYALFSPK